MDRNPYAPPVGNVEDPQVRSRRDRPREVNIALSLFGLALALSLPPVIYGYTSQREASHTPSLDLMAMTISLAILLGLACLVFIAIWKGWRWGRILYAIVVVLGTVSAFTAVPAWFGRSVFLGVTDLLSSLADIAALAMLFSPPANAFFRGMHRHQQVGRAP